MKPLSIQRMLRRFKVLICAAGAKCQIPCRQASACHHLRVGNHPAIKNGLPVKAVAWVERIGRKFLTHYFTNTDDLCLPTGMAGESSTLSDNLPGARANHTQVFVSVLKPLAMFVHGGLSPDEVKKVNAYRSQQIQMRDLRTVHEQMLTNQGGNISGQT